MFSTVTTLRHQLGQVVGAVEGAQLLEGLERAHLLDDGERVDRLRRRVELEHRLVDGAQRRVVEVVGDEELGDVVELARVHEDAADDRLLGFERMRRRGARAL